LRLIEQAEKFSVTLELTMNSKESRRRNRNHLSNRQGWIASFFVVPKLDNLDKFIEGIGQEDQERFNAPINQKKPKTSGLGRIRTGDLRHVKTP
jgi:hypothetical protein